MKIALNLLLVLLIGFLAYSLYNSIKEPIAFQEVKNYRKGVVTAKLEKIRKLQEIYKEINGTFAGSFADLKQSIMNDSIPNEMIIGDPDDPENQDKVIRKTIYFSAADTVRALGITLDSIEFVPFAGGKTFEIAADTIEYQSTKTNVVEVKTYWKDFMGKFANERYTKYDNLYDPKAPMKFGDMYKPTLAGNWN